MDAYRHLQVMQLVIVVFSVPYGLVMVTDFSGLASRTLDRLRANGSPAVSTSDCRSGCDPGVLLKPVLFR